MHEERSIDDELDDLNLELCEAQIAEQTALADNESPAAQNLAQLRVKRVELQIEQLQRRASSVQVDAAGDLLELDLYEKRIVRASMDLHGASEAERRKADLEVGLVELKLKRHKKRTERGASSGLPAAVQIPGAPAGSSAVQSSPANHTSRPFTALASSDVRSTPLGPVAAFGQPTIAAAPGITHLTTPENAHPRGPTSVGNSPTLGAPMAPTAPGSGEAGLGIAASQAAPVDRRGKAAPLQSGDQEAVHVERGLMGEANSQREPKTHDAVDASGAADSLREIQASSAYIEIDDDGARDITFPPNVSPQKSHKHASSAPSPVSSRKSTKHRTKEVDDEDFPLDGSPRAPKSRISTNITSKAAPPSSPLKAEKSSPVKAEKSAPPKAEQSSPPKPRALVNKSGRREPKQHPERWAFRVFNFGAACLAEAGGWSDESCCSARRMWTALVHWESMNDCKDGTKYAPALPSNMGDIVSKSRFPPTFFDVLKKLPDFVVCVAVCFEALRNAVWADVIKMHGPHGIAAVARALAEARRADDSFEEYFSLLAGELTIVLEMLAEMSTLRGRMVVDDGAVGPTMTSTVLAALEARAGYDVSAVTAALEDLRTDDTGKGTSVENGKKREASVSTAEPPPSPKRARSSR